MVHLSERFLHSMAMDLTVTYHETWDDLQVYVGGSAAAIGEMMMPILEPADPDEARPAARALGIASQLTNFLRDVVEDLDRGRVYLPQEDLRRFVARPHDPGGGRRVCAAGPRRDRRPPSELGPLHPGGAGPLRRDRRADRGQRPRRVRRTGGRER